MVHCVCDFFSLKIIENRLFKSVITQVVNKKNGVAYCFPGYIEVGNIHNFQKEIPHPGVHGTGNSNPVLNDYILSHNVPLF